MRRDSWPLWVAAACVLLLPAPVVRGQSGSGASLSGGFQLGFRVVEVGGQEDKYAEDVNLTDGPRLFRLSFELTPSRDLRDFIDRFQLDLSNVGGDPFETQRLAVKKYGRYSLKYERRKSSYIFNDDSSAAAAAAHQLGAGSFHSHDFERVQDTARLDLWLTKRAKLKLGFERFTKRGDGTLTLDVERDEFDLRSPIDESMNGYRVAFEYVWPDVTLAIEEEIRQYDAAVASFLPGFSEGHDPDDPTELDFFFLDQPYELLSKTHTARVLAHPGSRLTLRAAASLQDLGVDLQAAEHAQGIDYQGAEFSSERSGDGHIDRDSQLFDVDVSFLLNDRLALLGAVRRRELDQEGGRSLGTERGTGEWRMEKTGAEVGLRVVASRKLTLSGGVRHETRDLSSTWRAEGDSGGVEQETRQTGYFVSLGWRPTRRFRLSGGVEDGSFDGPFTPLSPTTQRLYRLRGQYGAGEGFSLSGSGRLNSVKNDASGWRSTNGTLNLRAGYRRASFSASLGYSLVAFERQMDQTVTTLPGFQGGVEFLVPIAYDVDSNIVDGRVIWSFVERWRLGGVFKLYDSDGSFAFQRRDLRGYVEVEIGADYVAHVGIRGLDYDEALHDHDDYDATIAEISIGYRW